jgi:hypothetical protein
MVQSISTVAESKLTGTARVGVLCVPLARFVTGRVAMVVVVCAMVAP